MRLRPPAPPLVAGALALALVAPTTASAAAPPPAAATAGTIAEPVFPVPASGSLTLVGKGYGHGRGMSQYGAAAAANAGRTWQQITSFYYPGTTRSTTSRTSLRVGLADTIGTGLRVRAASGLTAANATRTFTLPTSVTVSGRTGAVARWEVVPVPNATTSRLDYVRTDGIRGTFATAATWRLRTPSNRVQVTDPAGAPGRTYLGSIAGVRVGSAVQPVLTTSVDDYIRMVVPAEAIPSWPVAALSAQAVAARTYALSSLGSTSTAVQDVCSSTRCQVLGSITAETEATKAAATATSGVVLTRNGVPVRTEFSSSNGGWTADGGVPFLPAQADPYDRSTINPVNSWRADIPVTRIASAFPTLGRITGLQVVTRDGHGAYGGRVLSVRVIGALRTTTISGATLRTKLGSAVRSSWFVPVQPSRASSAPSSVRGAVLGVTTARVITGTNASALPSGGGIRLATVAGEWDATAGNDVLGVTTDGRLRLWSGTSTGFATPRDIGAGYGDVTALFTVDDLNGDRQRDLVVRRTDGLLHRFTADGRGGLLRGDVVVGSGWNGVLSVFSARVLDTGHDEMVAALWDGRVVAYPTTRRDTFTTRRILGTLKGYRSVSSFGDLTGDGRDDLVALDTSGTTWLVPVTADHQLGTRTRLDNRAGTASLL